MKDWHTTVFGLVGAIAANVYAYLSNNEKIDWNVLIISTTLAGVSFLARDAKLKKGEKDGTSIDAQIGNTPSNPDPGSGSAPR